MPDADDLLKSREVAELLNTDIRTVHRMAADGRLKVAVRVPGYRGAYLFRRGDLDLEPVTIPCLSRTAD